METLGKQPYNRDREKTCLIRENTSTSREEIDARGHQAIKKNAFMCVGDEGFERTRKSRGLSTERE